MPVFNAFESTNPLLKKNKPFSEGATAGTAKVSSRGAKSREELKSLGERNHWTVRELTMREIRQQMSADEVVWHELFNKENFDKAVERDAVAGERKDIDKQWAVRRLWEGKATPDESEKCRLAGDAFATRTPQFARTMENAMLMIEHMQAHDLDATKVESYVSAYKALVEDGKLTPAPAQSADDFLAQHPELIDRRTPPIIAACQAAAQNAAAHFTKTATATSEGSVTRLIDYGPRRHGVPPEPDKYSFKQKIRSMSASEIAQRCQDDPSFRKSLDELK